MGRNRNIVSWGSALVAITVGSGVLPTAGRASSVEKRTAMPAKPTTSRVVETALGAERERVHSGNRGRPVFGTPKPAARACVRKLSMVGGLALIRIWARFGGCVVRSGRDWIVAAGRTNSGVGKAFSATPKTKNAAVGVHLRPRSDSRVIAHGLDNQLSALGNQSWFQGNSLGASPKAGRP